MSKLLFLTHVASRRNINRKLSTKRRSFFSVKIFNVLILIAICSAGIWYIANINNIATKGFKTKELEEKQAILKEGIKKGEFQVADMQSVQKIKERVNILNMVAVARTEYASTASTVAVNK